MNKIDDFSTLDIKNILIFTDKIKKREIKRRFLEIGFNKLENLG